MNILYVITQAEIGGAQKYVLSLASHFKGTILAGTDSDEIFLAAKKLGIPTMPAPWLTRGINPVKNLRALLALRNLYKRFKPDIVHLNSSMAGFVGSLAGFGLPIKIVYTAHGFVFRENLPWLLRGLYVLLEWLAGFFRHALICVSSADKEAALSFHLISPRLITLIYNGLPILNFLDKEQALKQLGLPHNTFIFGTIAHAYHTKGLDILLDAARHLPAGAICAIIGQGPLLHQLQAQAQAEDLPVLFLGPKPEGYKYLKAFDCFVLPSRKEGFPFAIIEALQAGLPIIASDVGGIPEAIGQAGLLVPAQNPQALANALQNLLNDHQLRLKLSNLAKQQALLFTETALFDKTQKIYQRLLGQTG